MCDRNSEKAFGSALTPVAVSQASLYQAVEWTPAPRGTSLARIQRNLSKLFGPILDESAYALSLPE